MIKRLKWNVLYGGGGGEESDGGLSSSSDESADADPAERQARANALLQQLVERDPDMAETLHNKLRALASSSDDDDDDEVTHADDVAGMKRRKGAATAGAGDSDSESEGGDVGNGADLEAEELGEDMEHKEEEDPDTEYAEWRECELCPGKRFLNDKEVDAHLSSKKHLRAVAKLEKRRVAAGDHATGDHAAAGPANGVAAAKEGSASNRPAKATDESTEGKPEERIKKEQKRKAAAKRKLKALKRRKWEAKANSEIRGSVEDDEKDLNGENGTKALEEGESPPEMKLNDNTAESPGGVQGDAPVASKKQRKRERNKRNHSLNGDPERPEGKKKRRKSLQKDENQSASVEPGVAQRVRQTTVTGEIPDQGLEAPGKPEQARKKKSQSVERREDPQPSKKVSAKPELAKARKERKQNAQDQSPVETLQQLKKRKKKKSLKKQVPKT